MIASVGHHRDYGTARAVSDNEIAMIEFVHFSVGCVFALGIDDNELTAIDNLCALIHKAHVFTFSVRLYRAEKLHAESSDAALERMLGCHGVELSGKHDKAGQNVVEKIEMVGYYKLPALEGAWAFFILIKRSSFEKQKLERVTEHTPDYTKDRIYHIVL